MVSGFITVPIKPYALRCRTCRWAGAQNFYTYRRGGAGVSCNLLTAAYLQVSSPFVCFSLMPALSNPYIELVCLGYMNVWTAGQIAMWMVKALRHGRSSARPQLVLPLSPPLPLMGWRGTKPSSLLTGSRGSSLFAFEQPARLRRPGL